MTALAPIAAPSAGLLSTPPIAVPADFQAQMDQAFSDGVADGTTFADEHSPAERRLIVDWALLRMKFPPKTDDEDLKYLHDLANKRTPEGISAAQYWAKHGLTDEWEKLLDDYTSKVGPAQARAARKLLHDALMMTNIATQVGKASANRQRPFAVDPTLKLAVDKPGNNPSYPSGHTSAAYAACMVLAHLMPDRKAEFMSLAAQASFARMYAGVHFPTDVVAGVKMAATIVSYLDRTSMAAPVRGTKKAKNTGVAGGLPGAPIPGAAKLVGQPIPA